MRGSDRNQLNLFCDAGLHEERFTGLVSAERGPLEGGPYRVLECVRCGACCIEGVTLPQMVAAIELANARRERR